MWGQFLGAIIGPVVATGIKEGVGAANDSADRAHEEKLATTARDTADAGARTEEARAALEGTTEGGEGQGTPESASYQMYASLMGFNRISSGRG